jgi:hypothetical protein
VKTHFQSGVTLVETAVAAAIVALAVGAALWAVAAFGKHVAQQGGPARTGALIYAQQTLRVAQDAWKYGSPGDAPSGSQTIGLSIGAASTTPAELTTAVRASTTRAQITVHVQYTPEPDRTADPGVVSVSGDVDAKAPLPGSLVNRPGLIPAPSGSP